MSEAPLRARRKRVPHVRHGKRYAGRRRTALEQRPHLGSLALQQLDLRKPGTRPEGLGPLAPHDRSGTPGDGRHDRGKLQDVERRVVGNGLLRQRPDLPRKRPGLF
ncbi:MAG: hypothetical protein IMX02_01820 [Limnochordaceae bacterium]|nr:hypothetical protein [Limnochordaceae bacterium]